MRFFRREFWDQERNRELEAYLEIETAENVARGMDPAEARNAARRKLGNQTHIREEIYRMNTLGWFESVLMDFRYGFRVLRLNPGFTFIAIASLALGIGANAAMFQLIDSVRLRSLPVEKPQRLAEVRISNFKGARGNFTGWHSDFNNPLWEYFRDHQTVFDGVLAWSRKDFNISPTGEERHVQGLYVSGDFFPVLGVRPAIGRLFTQQDDRRGCGAAGVVISDSFWTREFSRSTNAIGKTLTLDGHPLPVIGVTQAGFFGLEVGRSFDVAVPICAEAVLRPGSRLDAGHEWWLQVMGRLRAGSSFEQATAILAASSAPLFRATLPPEYPRESVQSYLDFKLAATPAGTGISFVRETYSTALLLLIGITALVLVIACANLANLILARSNAREREIAVRLAIGASASRLFRQLIAESLLLAGAGAAAGFALAQIVSRSLVAFLNNSDALFLDLAPNWHVLGFTAALAIFTCTLFGVAPAIRATRTDPGSSMKNSGRGIAGGRERFGIRRTLVAFQVALSLVLLAGALLFAQSLRNLMQVDAGFHENGVLIVQLNAAKLKLSDAQLLDLHTRVVDDFRALPGVDAAAETFLTPLSGNSSGRTAEMNQHKEAVSCNWISSGYFRTLAVRLLAGRDIDSHDGPNSFKVAIVNEAFARRFTNGSNPVGLHFRMPATPRVPVQEFEIIGLVSDTKYDDLRETFGPIAYFSIAQLPMRDDWPQLLVHGNVSQAALTASIRDAVRRISPEVTFDFTVLKSQIEGTLTREHLIALLSGAFGIVAAMLASVGLYGVTSFMVTRRRNEIGIRIALGAARSSVMRMILAETAVLVAVGLTAGTVLMLAASGAVASFLYGLAPRDPFTIGTAIAVLATISLLAAYIPARRAASVDPMITLRED